MCVCVHIYIVIWHMCVCVYDNVLFVIAATKDLIPPGEVCSGETATSCCSRDDNVLEWSIGVKRIVLLREESNASIIMMVDGINFTVTRIFQNTTLIISNISFTATPAADGKVLSCTGGGTSVPATISVVTNGKLL